MTNKKLPVVWYYGLKDENKEKLEKLLLSSYNHASLVRLKQILKQRLEDLSQKETNYDNPSWSHLQAHCNGQRAELKYILDLLEFVQG